jgi:hypothetical protein
VLEQLGEVSAYYDVQVDALADRDAYDARPSGYRVLVSDVGDGRAAIFSKASSIEADWSDPAYFSGPKGAQGDVGPIGVNWRDTAWSSSTTYALNDGTLRNGSSWRSLQGGNLNHAPPTLPTTSNAWWSLIAAKGQDGAGTIVSIEEGVGIIIDNSDPTAPVISVDSSVLSFPVAPSARLSLASGVAVTSSDIVGATTVYVVPVGHVATTLFDGTVDVSFERDQLSVELDGTAHPAAKNFDVFEALVAGEVVAGTGPDWSAGATAGSAIARGIGTGSTEVELFHGRMVNKNQITIRVTGGETHVVAARCANLIGSFRTVLAGETEDSCVNRLVSSALTPTVRAMEHVDTSDNWSYSVAAWRQANASESNRIAYLASVGGGMAEAVVNCVCSSSDTTTVFPSVGIGVDSSTVNKAILMAQATSTVVSGVGLGATYKGSPGVGYHEIRWLEYGGGAASTQTWYGDAGGAQNFRSGIVGSVVN